MYNWISSLFHHFSVHDLPAHSNPASTIAIGMFVDASSSFECGLLDLLPLRHKFIVFSKLKLIVFAMFGSMPLFSLILSESLL